MRKTIFRVFLLLSLSACDPKEWLESRDTYWYIKNTTKIPLLILPQMDTVPRITLPCESLMIHWDGILLGYDTIYPFERLHEVVDKITICDTSENVLKEWLLENILEEEESIFRKENWVHYKVNYNKEIWVYETPTTCNHEISNIDTTEPTKTSTLYVDYYEGENPFIAPCNNF